MGLAIRFGSQQGIVTMIWQIEIAVILAVLLVTNSCTWYFTRQHGQNVLYAVQLDMAKAVQDELIKQQKVAAKRLVAINQSQVQHDKDQIVNTQLHDQLERLQIHGICSDPMHTAATATPSANAGAWTFSETVDANFARLQQRTTELFRQCDQINVDAIRTNSQTICIAPLN